LLKKIFVIFSFESFLTIESKKVVEIKEKTRNMIKAKYFEEKNELRSEKKLRPLSSFEFM
jgi:hypothetical protein